MAVELPYELLIRYYRKETSPPENRRVEQWLGEEDHLSLYLTLRQEWKFIDDNTRVIPDKTEVWKAIQTHISGKKRNRYRFRLFISAVAACMVLLLTISVFLYLTRTPQRGFFPEQYTVFKTGENEKSTIELPDGSSIRVNSDSYVSISNHFNAESREIELDGEIFVDVSPSTKKFIIHAGKIRVEVLGTSFLMRAFRDEDTVGIFLKRGRVAVYDKVKEEKILEMDSAQCVRIDTRDLHYEWSLMDQNHFDIPAKENLSVYNEPLSQIIPKLEQWYGVKFICSGLDTSTHYTFQLKEENIDEFMELFSFMVPIDYYRDGKKIYLNAKAPY